MRIAVLCGGRSHERAVSLRSGARIEQALRTLGHEPELIDADSDVTPQLDGAGFDVAFIALHGRGGEDGTVQGQLERLGLAYTGSRAEPSAAAYHKDRAKRLLAAAGVPTPAFVALSEQALEQQGATAALDEARETIGFPLVVKPARGGSSLGTRFVDEASALPRALMGAMSYDVHVLVERHVEGREFAVVIVGGGGGHPARALPTVEIVPRQADWFDYESRYEHGATEFTCPPTQLDDAVGARIEQVALAAFDALDCSGFGRVDLIVDDAAEPWVLEVATVPGMTDTSLVPLACEAAGMTFLELVQSLLDDALAQRDEA